MSDITRLSSQLGTESTSVNDSSNPYIGPRAFKRDRRDQSRFFGRDTEKDEIISRIMSHRLTLVYAQSGAGKTSIFNAEIIPALENEGFEVLPMTRVAITQIKPSDNTYIYNALLYIRDTVQDDIIRKKIDTQSLLDLSLFEFLDYNFPIKRNKDMNPIPQVLIFDQLEDLFIHFPDKWIEQRNDFFEQISDSLDNNPSLRVVFIIREDYLAQLDPYRNIVPEKLRPSFRLEKLRREEATLAITGPLIGIIKNLSEEEAQGIELEINDLVNDLLKSYIQLPNGDLQQLEGEFVEPIHLQVVCRKWWNERTQKETREKSKLKQLAVSNVDSALEEFYDKSVDEAKNIGSTEKRIRKWCEEKLITPSGTRSIIHRSTSSTEGMSNKIVDALEGQYLIRREWRSGSPWYELTHDRLVKPIKDSNKKWEFQKTKFSRSLLRKRIIIPVIIAIVIGIALATMDAHNKSVQQGLLNEAFKSFNSNDKEGAMRYYDEVLAINPTNRDALFGKAITLSSSGNFTGAVYYYDKVLEINNNDIDALYNKGVILDKLGNSNESMEAFNRALAVDPTYINALQGKGYMLTKLGNYTGSIEYYNKALAIDPTSTIILNNKGLALHHLGRYEEAISYYDKALTINSTFVLSLYNKGLALTSLGQYEEAISHYDKALEMDPTNANVLYIKGLALYNLGRYEEAIPYYDRSLVINSTNDLALYNRALSLYNLGRYEEAISYFDKALEIDPTNANVTFYSKALSLYYLGRYEEAISYYDKALAIDPTSTNILNNKGLSLYYLGRYEEAIPYNDRSLAINSTDIVASYNKGLNLHNLGRYEEAIPYYDRSLAINSTDVGALYNKGLALDNLGRNKEAISYYDKVLKINATNVDDALNGKAYALAKLGENEEALEHIERALKSIPNNEYYLSTAALIMYNLGNYDEATSYYERALRIDPNITEKLEDIELKAFNSLMGNLTQK